MGKPKLKCLQNQAITDRVGCAAINAVGKTVLLTTPASSEPLHQRTDGLRRAPRFTDFVSRSLHWLGVNDIFRPKICRLY